MRGSNDIWNIPNLLTFFRIALIPLLVLFLLSPSELLSILSVVVFSIASITDWLDGYLARKMNIVTNLGKFLDPIADKLLIAAALVMLVGLGRIPAWMVVVIIGREIAVTGLRSIASSEGIILLWVALALTAWSGFDYFYKFMKVILKEPQKAP